MGSVTVKGQDERQMATGRSKSWAETFLFGRVDFGESEEYQEFQFKFLSVVVFLGALFTMIFIAGAYSKLNPLNNPHLQSMTAFTASTLLLWLALRGHKERFQTLAWTYEVLCALEYISALMFVPEDELRILWFYTNIPGVYILLGQRAGLVVTVLSLLGLAFGNAYLSRPYSPNAMATALVSLSYLALFFHVYGTRSISYFTRMREANRQLQDLASHDMLTGVLNARAYYQRCDAMISMAQRDRLPFAVLFVDLDHFKSINDTHGHDAGDLVLKSVANCLAKNIRQSDEIGRIGGEEFSIFLHNTKMAGARQLAEVIRQSIESLMPDTGHHRLRITASIGVADSTTEQTTMRSIQQRADTAMYVAKATGRNRVSCFDAQTGDQSAARLNLDVPVR
jgi:diguanylate cyclase (GGDEF)-like protein